MNPDDSLNASFWLMVFLQTMGSFDPMPGTGPRKMPPPSAYVPIIIAWGVLQLGADAGWERPASKFGWLMVLTGVVLGPFGKRLIKLINWVTSEYGASNVTGSTSTSNPSMAAGVTGSPTQSA